MINALNKKANFVEKALSYSKNKLSVQETRWLLEHVSGFTYNRLLTDSEAPLTQDQYHHFCQLTDRISQGEPLDYVVGFSIFRDRQFIVSPAVLIPRPETETVIDIAKGSISSMVSPDILELGTGSGIIAISFALEMPNAQITATDISSDALAIARQNAKNHQVTIHFLQSRWFDHIEGNYDLIVSNPPYIAENDPHLTGLPFEPILALTSGACGLDAIIEIMDQATDHLNDGGWLWIEHGYDQAEACQRLLSDGGYQQVQNVIDAFGNPRISGGQWITSKK